MDKKPRDPQNPSGPVVVQKLKVTVDRNLCIGAATCVAVAPQTFLMDSEAKAIIIQDVQDDTAQTILDAAKACPVAAITVEDETGKKLFPA